MPTTKLRPPVARARRSASSSIVRSATGFSAIRASEIEICIWRRPIPRKIDAYVQNHLLPLALDERTSGSPTLRTVERLLQHLPDADGAVELRDDVLRLASAFAENTGYATLEMRLERVDDDMCRRFHVDRYPCRLLCTYAGPGTQWLENRDVLRERLGSAGLAFPNPEDNMVRPGAKIRQLRPFDVAVLKGELWHDPKSLGAVHRSPPIMKRKAQRLLLKIDVVRKRPTLKRA